MSPAKQGTAGNGGNGILITDAATSPVGTATRWNTISANGLAGIAIHGTVGTVKSSTSAAIDYNRIGTDPTGTIDMGNGGDGIAPRGPARARCGGRDRRGAGNADRRMTASPILPSSSLPAFRKIRAALSGNWPFTIP